MSEFLKKINKKKLPKIFLGSSGLSLFSLFNIEEDTLKAMTPRVMKSEITLSVLIMMNLLIFSMKHSGIVIINAQKVYRAHSK